MRLEGLEVVLGGAWWFEVGAEVVAAVAWLVLFEREQAERERVDLEPELRKLALTLLALD